MSFKLLLVTVFSAAVASAPPALAGRFWAASFWACLMVAWAELTSLVIASMPFDADLMVWTAFDIESSRPDSWPERLFSEFAVKKLTGLSMAVLTRRPVASLCWISVCALAVCWRDCRFWRTPGERIALLMVGLLPLLFSRHGRGRVRQ